MTRKSGQEVRWDLEDYAKKKQKELLLKAKQCVLRSMMRLNEARS